jgi:hypothetical protein
MNCAHGGLTEIFIKTRAGICSVVEQSLKIKLLFLLFKCKIGINELETEKALW